LKYGSLTDFLADDLLQVSNVKVAEHLAQGLQECSRVEEIIRCGGLSGSDATTSVVLEFEIELEQLRSKVDHLKAQVSLDLLSIVHHVTVMLTDYQHVGEAQLYVIVVLCRLLNVPLNTL